MKKVLLFVVFSIFLAAASLAYAHPPSDIKITFDAKTKMLHAVILHNVKDALKHYINKVDVALNGKKIIEHNISKQDNNESQAVDYLIPDAKDGDVLSVDGFCSIVGNLKKDIIVIK